MGLEGLDRIDPFPYRHRVEEVMSAPLLTVGGGTPLGEAARLMAGHGVSSVIVDPEGAAGGPGIVTERDVLRAVAEAGGEALSRPCAEVMSAPLHTVAAGAFVYEAIGRMQRLGKRHLAVADAAGRPVGMVTGRALLKLRSTAALALGDEIAEAGDGPALAAVHRALPALAAGLRAEGMAAREVAAVLSATLRGLSARAMEIALAEQGAPPAPFAFLVLGSGGRGESMLSADQDNAIVHGGAEEADDAWFAALGARASDLLDAAGVPYCKGGVMASRPAWRHSLEGWRRTVGGWVAKAEGETLLSVDIFYDFRLCHGDAALAADLRAAAMTAASRPRLPLMMAGQLEGVHAPIGLLGGIRTEEGRVDLKLHGLFPIVAGARAMALRHGVAETGTLDRLRAAAAVGLLGEEDVAALEVALGLFMDLVLDQQVADLAAGRDPGTRVEAAGLPRSRRRQLKEALRTAAHMAETTRAALGAR